MTNGVEFTGLMCEYIPFSIDFFFLFFLDLIGEIRGPSNICSSLEHGFYIAAYEKKQSANDMSLQAKLTHRYTVPVCRVLLKETFMGDIAI